MFASKSDEFSIQVKLFILILRQYSKSPERNMFAENSRINCPAVVIDSVSWFCSVVGVLRSELFVFLVCSLFSKFLLLPSWGLSSTLPAISTALLFYRASINSLYYAISSCYTVFLLLIIVCFLLYTETLVCIFLRGLSSSLGLRKSSIIGTWLLATVCLLCFLIMLKFSTLSVSLITLMLLRFELVFKVPLC